MRLPFSHIRSRAQNLSLRSKGVIVVAGPVVATLVSTFLFFLAVLDWMMPGLEGTEICRRVREINKSVYIILLTARTSKERIVEALEAGADDYLAKPFDKGELRARLNVGLRLLSLQASLAARIEELEATQAENRELKLRIPL